LEALGKLKANASYARIGIACLRQADSGRCQALAEKLRKEGVPCDVFLDEAKLPKQYMLGEKKGLKWLIIPDEGVSGSLTLRNLETRENREGKVEELVGILKG
jgi:histidyl-tRNA synthetase